MEELSTYFNMDYFNQNPFSQISSTFYEEEPILAPQVIEQNLPAYDESFFFLPNTAFGDSYNFDQANLFYPHYDDYASAYYDPIFTSLSSDDNNYILPPEDDYNFSSSKRQKCFQENNNEPNNNFFDGYVHNPCSMIMKSEEEAQFFATTMQQEFKVPQFSQGVLGESNYYGGDNEIVIKGNEKSNISQQSLTARERRRKITVKTQELGKLVPGGSKLNTAEMLNAAGKYVQYLQAQVEMLQLMRTLQVIHLFYILSHFGLNVSFML